MPHRLVKFHSVAQPHYFFQPDTNGFVDLFRAEQKTFSVPLIVANALSSVLLSLGQLTA